MYLSTLKAPALALLLQQIHAYVIPPTTNTNIHTINKRASAVDQLTGMLSNPSACSSSTSGECVSPSKALDPILDGLYKYNIDTGPEQAAIVSLMAFESVDFQFNHNVSPGRPGQGTRAMFMPNFVAEYVASLPELSSAAAGAGGDPVKLLKLVQDDAHSFAAASWFYSTKCSAGVKQGLQSGGRAGWVNYITSCVGTTVTAEREAYWKKACQQLGVVV